MEKDKRYLLFEYDTYYPLGAMSDLSSSFDTLEEAKEKASESKYNYDIYDRIEGIIVG